MNSDRLHSADSAAELLGIRPSTIRWWWSIGRIPRVKIGRLTRVRESILLALIDAPINTRHPADNPHKMHVNA